MELSQWAFIAAAFVIAPILPIVPIMLAQLLAPRRPSETKVDVYECGVETVGDTWGQIKIQYYLYAIIFLVFDVEMVFLFPWAVALDGLDFSAYLAGLVFIFLLVEGLIYAWRKGALEWS
jgi:NADH:ubiquinone oxidoreductase subunit 3 (subunit A)